MDAEANARRVNAHYAQKRTCGASAPSKVDIATHAAQTRWAGRGGPSTTIRISRLVAARLYKAVPQPDRRAFVEAAIEDSLNRTTGHTQ